MSDKQLRPFSIKTVDEVYNNKKWFIQNYYWDDSNYIYNTNDDKTKKPMDIILNDIIDEDFIDFI